MPHSKTRIHVVRLDGSDYIVATRPLYASPEDVAAEAERLRGRGFRVAASIVADRLSGYMDLLDALGGGSDMVEIDLGLFYALYGYRRGFESYALDILEELVPISPVPLAAKFSPNMPLSREFLGEVEKIGVNMLVFSTHPVYTVGDEIFRVHSTHLSLIYGSIWSSIVSEGLNSSKLVTVEAGAEGVDRVFSGILYDTALIMRHVKSRRVENSFPTEWVEIPGGVFPAVTGDWECVSACPLGAFKDEAGGETVAADPEVCDLCGLCLSMCGTHVVLARELTPQ